MNKRRLSYLLLSTLTFISGYLFIKNAYLSTVETPFTQEIVLIVLGSIATILITAALLSKQSEVEIDKEQRLKFFNIKTDLYFELIAFIESLIRKKEIEKTDLITLEFLTHKISIVANPEVLQEYSNFVQTIKETSDDTKISMAESNNMNDSLAKLCGKIRYDLIKEDDISSAEIQGIINSNSKVFRNI